MTLSRPLPPLLPVYDPAATAEPPEVVFPLLAAGGARWVEYRDKVAADRDFYLAARGAAQAARDVGLSLLVNDRVEIALALAVGVHLGQEDLPAAVARRLLGPQAIIGLSADSLEDVRAADTLPVDYVAVGPVYATGSKADAGAPVGLEHVTAARALTARPLVAIGGVDADRAEEVVAAGADAVAVLAAVLGATDIVTATRSLREAAQRGRRRRGAR